MADELLNVPQDLTLLSDQEVIDLEAAAVAEFDRVNTDQEVVTADSLQYQVRLQGDIDRVRAEKAGREARATQAAELQRARLVEERARLRSQVHGPEAGGEGEPGEPGSATAAAAARIDTESIARAAAEGATAALVAVIGGERVGRIDLNKTTQRATASLSEARRFQTQPRVPTPRLAITAGVDIPGVARGTEMTSLDDLVDAVQRAAKGTPVSRDGQGQERLVATIRNEFEHVIDDRTSPAQVEELFKHLTRKENQDALVAGGGWCAPSEIRYGFFNIACSDGLVDLPTFGVTRGGIRYPTSPSLADAVYDVGSTGTANKNLAGYGALFSNASDPWLWTETDDIATVTGTPNKPTMRVPCPSFNENRLECYGLTMTAGNLTDSAYPEATANTLKLLMSAFEHAKNARYISQMVALSTAAIVISGASATNRPVFNQVLSGIDLGATDYRAKFGMCDSDVLEVVAPYWVKDCITADLAWRTKVELLSVTDAQITQFFTDRYLSVQWVNDWQVRGAGQFGAPGANMTAWPVTADFLVYAAGTFIKGNGLTLDLGVVRDSILNAENDFTAAWSEECHLIAKVGHESRRYTIPFIVSGADSFAVSAAAQI